MTHDWISLINLINPIPLFGLISSILWFDLISFSISSELVKSYLLIRFNYFDSAVLPLTSLWKIFKDAPNYILDNIIG